MSHHSHFLSLACCAFVDKRVSLSGDAPRSYLEIHRCTVHEHSGQSASVPTGLCQWFVLCPLQTNPMWPGERATAGVSRRAPSQGAPTGHRAITPKLWQGYPPICWENQCCPMIGHPIDWGNMATGRRRQRAPCQQLHPCREGCLELPSIHPLPYLFFQAMHSGQQTVFITYLHIYEGPSFDSFLSGTLCIEMTWDRGQKVWDVVPSWNQGITAGNAAVIANTIPAKERHGYEFTRWDGHCHPICPKEC